MTTASPSKSDIRVADGQVDLTLMLELEPDSTTALVRTLVVLHRRCFRVTEARYQSAITNNAAGTHAHSISAALATLCCGVAIALTGVWASVDRRPRVDRLTRRCR